MIAGAVIFIVVLAVAHGLGWLAVILAFTAFAGYYRFDVWRRPLVPCRWCQGGRKPSPLTGAFGRCWRCHGRNAHPRPALRILAPGVWREISEGKHGRNY